MSSLKLTVQKQFTGYRRIRKSKLNNERRLNLQSLFYFPKTVLNYDAELDMIVYDHLISETEEPNKPDTFIPDGDYEGFKWKDGQWLHVDKVFNFKLEDGQSPADEKIRDAQGNIDEKKLEEASQRNLDRAKPPVKKTDPKKKDQ